MTDIAERLRTALADRYDLERVLGTGGMATVYLARDRRQDRLVAMKVLNPELAASLGAERFLREIAISAHLTHPNILPLHDSGEADAFLYYTMPYIEGESLRDRLDREKQLPLEDALGIICEVSDALAHAHAQGVVHRDVKPENILLEAGHAVVADFGVARAITRAGGEELTKTGLAVGTPTYMSPEQATGSREVDGRSDLYSLGCVLYEMLAGDPPYTASTPQALIARKLNEPLPRVSVVREAVPPHIEAALARAMARVPADRFRSGTEFVAALRARAWSAPAPAGAGGRRIVRRTALALAALLTLAGLALLARPLVRALISGRSGTAYTDTPRWSAWRGWIGEGFSVVAVSLKKVVVSRGRGDAHAFDGRRWTTLRMPEGFELRPHVGRLAGHRLFGVKTSRGPSGQDQLQYWWLSLSPHALVPSQPLSGLLPDLEGRPSWWSDGRDVVTYFHTIQRLAGDTWVGEPTATTGFISRVWGRDAAHRFAISFSPADSLLVFDGISWRLVDPLGGRGSGRASFVGGATLPDGATVVVGEECDRQERCGPLILEEDSFGARWRRVDIPAGIGIPTAPRRDTTGACDPGAFALWDVAGRSRDDYVVSGLWTTCEGGHPPREATGCPPRQPCFWQAVRRSLRPVVELVGRQVVATVFVDTTAYALADDGTLWRRVGASWRAVTRVPGLPARLVAASPHVIVRVVGSDIRYEPGGSDTLSGFFVSPGIGRPPGVSETKPPRQLVVHDSAAALLTADGGVYLSRCRMVPSAAGSRGAGLSCPAWRRLPAATGHVQAIVFLADGRLLGVGWPGLAVTWAGETLTRETLPAAVRADSLWAVVSSVDGGETAIGRTAVVRRDVRGTWTLVRPWRGNRADLGRFGAPPDGDLVTAGRVIRVWDRSADTLPVITLYNPTPSDAEVSALHVLSDGRLVAGFTSPADRILGGRLMVWARPARAGRAERVDLPLNLDVTDLADDGRYLYVVGRGGALRIPIDALPFGGALRASERRATVGRADR